MKNTIEKIMKDIQAMTSIISTRPNEYDMYRSQFNADVIQVITGLELDLDNSDKNGYAKVVKVHRLPSQEQFALLISAIDTYIETVEKPFIESIKAVNGDNGMEWYSHMPTSIPEKVDKKSFKEAIQASFINYMTVGDFVLMSAMTVKYRKRVRNFAAVFTGVTLVVAGGVGYYAYNRYQAKHSTIPLIGDECGDLDGDLILDDSDITDDVVYDDDLDPSVIRGIQKFGAPKAFGTFAGYAFREDCL